MDQASKLRALIKETKTKQHTSKVITVTSGKGGVGKSNMSINLAIQLSKAGNRVVILDADFGLANVEVMLGIRPTYSLIDLIHRRKDIKEIITKGPENIGFISGGSGIRDMLQLSEEQHSYLLTKLYELDELADYIIIDTGAGISDCVLEFIETSSETLLVVTPEPTSITDAYAVLKMLNLRELFLEQEKSIKVVCNRVQGEKDGIQLFEKLNVVVKRFLKVRIEYIGSVVQDDCVMKSVMQQKPISIAYPRSNAVKGYRMIANRMMEQKQETKQNESGIKFVFSRMFHKK